MSIHVLRVVRPKGGLVPLYQFFCDKCFEPYEITMKIKELDEHDRGELEVKCPECRENLRKLICPPRRINIH